MITEKDLDILHKRINGLSRELQRIKANSAPTLPIYDSANFPQDAVEGQIALDTASAGWVYGSDDTWHQLGGGLSVAGINQWYNQFSTAVVDGSSAPLVPDTDASGPTYITTGPFNCNIITAGLYSVQAVINNIDGTAGTYTIGGSWEGQLATTVGPGTGHYNTVTMPNTAWGPTSNSNSAHILPPLNYGAGDHFSMSILNNDGGGNTLHFKIQFLTIIKYA